MKHALPLLLCAFIAFAAGCCERGTPGKAQANAGVEMVFRCPAAFGAANVDGHGVIDRTGKVIVPPIYDEMALVGDLLIVSKDGWIGLLAADGSELAPCRFLRATVGDRSAGFPMMDSGHGPYIPQISRMSAGIPIAVVENWRADNKYAGPMAFRLDGTPLVDDEFTECHVVNMKCLAMRKESDGKMRLYDFEGREILGRGFDTCSEVLSLPLVAIETEGKWSAFDLESRRLIEIGADKIKTWYDDMLPFSISGKWGFLDAHGNPVIPAQFHDVNAFSEGLCAVAVCQQEGDLAAGKEPQALWGFIDCSGKFVIPPRFAAAGTFHGGYAGVRTDFASETWSHIDTKGVIVPDAEYDKLYRQHICDGVGQTVSGVLIRTETGEAICGKCTSRWYNSHVGILFFTDGDSKCFLDPRTGFALDPGRYKLRDLEPWAEGLLLGRTWGGYVLLDYGGLRIGPEYKDVSTLSDGFARFKYEESVLYGYLDSKGNVVIAPKYLRASDFSGGLAAVGDSKMGFIDRTGKWVIEPQYTSAWGFEDGFAIVRQAGKLGVIDTQGRQVLPFEFSSLNAYNGKCGSFSTSAKWGALDETGRTVIEPRFSSMTGFKDGYAVVSVGGLFGTIDASGEYVIEPQYDGLERIGKDVLAYRAEAELGRELYGFLSSDGSKLCEPKFYSIRGELSEGLVAACWDIGDRRIRYGFADLDGNWVIPPKYTHVKDFSEGRAAVHVDDYYEGPWGFIDREGNMVVLPKYYDVGSFHDGRARVEDAGLAGYIDPEGNEAIQQRYTRAGDFHGGYAEVEDGEKEYLIDRDGEEMERPDICSGQQVPDGYIAQDGQQESGLFGVVDFSRMWLIEPQFTCLVASKNGYPLIGVLDGRHCAVDESGMVTFEENWTEAQKRASRGYRWQYDPERGYGVFDLFGNRMFTWRYEFGWIAETPLKFGAAAERNARSRAREK